MIPLTVPLWSRLLDRMHIIRFRTFHCWTFVATTITILLAVALRQPQLLWLSAALQGVAIGGGVLGWNLGHHDFAPLELTSQYMGVHVTLTGIRGLIGPPLAVGLYGLLMPLDGRTGAGVFAVCLGLNLVGAVAFALLNRSWQRLTTPEEASAVACSSSSTPPRQSAR
jgi:hypothetical protein